MHARKARQFLSGVTGLVAVLGFGLVCAAQDSPQPQPPQQAQDRPILSQDRIGTNPTGQSEAQPLRPADGQRHGLPLETYGVAPGTKFLVALEEDLGTKGTQEKAKFKVRTLEPLEAPAGEMRLIAAAAIGGTRLIDNLALGSPVHG